MQIWNVRMILNYGLHNEMILSFVFEKDEHDDWKYNEQQNKYTRADGWLFDDENAYLTFETNNMLCIAKASKSFDHELNEEELEVLKRDMRNGIIEALNIKLNNTTNSIKSQIDFATNCDIIEFN